MAAAPQASQVPKDHCSESSPPLIPPCTPPHLSTGQGRDGDLGVGAARGVVPRVWGAASYPSSMCAPAPACMHSLQPTRHVCQGPTELNGAAQGAASLRQVGRCDLGGEC
jgi:hypothetical protein